MSLFDELAGARFSPCRKYRYELWRQWDPDKPFATFIMLNPSTADEISNDKTVEKCQRRSLALGFGGLRVANIFAFRSTYPKDLYPLQDPIGPDNDAAILAMAKPAGIVICGWGTHGNHMERGATVRQLLLDNGIVPYYLHLNDDGTPQHPLYVSYETQPKPWG